MYSKVETNVYLSICASYIFFLSRNFTETFFSIVFNTSVQALQVSSEFLYFRLVKVIKKIIDYFFDF